MGKTINASDLLKKPFSDLTVSEQAAVLKARYDEETSEPGSQSIKTRSTIGEEYGLSGSSVQFCPVGVYTIMEVKSGKVASAGWRRLKSGIGWISLDFVKKV